MPPWQVFCSISSALPLSLVGILAVPDSTGPLATAVLFAIPAVCALVQVVGLWLGPARAPGSGPMTTSPAACTLLAAFGR